MKLVSEIVAVEMEVGVSIRDVTEEVCAFIKKSKVKKGVLHANIVGSTGSITTIEYEPGVIEDLKQAINRFAPQIAKYQHDWAWGDGNGHSHVQAAIIGPSVSIGVLDGKPTLGTWQQIVAINHDIKPRSRQIVLTLVGE